jgi:hypothetical protein
VVDVTTAHLSATHDTDDVSADSDADDQSAGYVAARQLR